MSFMGAACKAQGGVLEPPMPGLPYPPSHPPAAASQAAWALTLPESASAPWEAQGCSCLRGPPKDKGLAGSQMRCEVSTPAGPTW